MTNIYQGLNASGNLGPLWQPAYWYAPNGSVSTNTSNWVLNPFNQSTPISSVYTPNNSFMNIYLQQVPAVYTNACGAQYYVSGTIQTQPTFRQLYGYFEASVAVSKYQGVYYTFSLQTDQQNPPEIDIFNITALQGSSNWFSQCGVWDITSASLLPANTWQTSYNQIFNTYDVTQFHSYGVEWKEEGMTFYIDRIKVFHSPRLPGYTLPMFPVLSVSSGVDGIWSGPIVNPTNLPAVMQINYVHAWRNKPF